MDKDGEKPNCARETKDHDMVRSMLCRGTASRAGHKVIIPSAYPLKPFAEINLNFAGI